MTVANTNGAGAVVNGESGGGAGLPTAAGADEVPVSTGAGTTYVATPLTTAVGDTLADLYGALDAGDFYVSDGAGGTQLASDDAAAVRGIVGAAATVTTTRGDLIRRGASADERVALGAVGTVLTSDGTDAVWSTAPGSWTVVEPTSWSVRSGTRGTAAIASGRVDLTNDGVAEAYYDSTSRTAPRAYYAIPAGVADVAVIGRMYTRTSGSANGDLSTTVLLRPGTDDTAAPSASVSSTYTVATGLTQMTMPGVGDFNSGVARLYSGEFSGAASFGTVGAGGGVWPANGVVNTFWVGVRWFAGRLAYGVAAAPATSPPTPESMLWTWPAQVALWAAPGLAILTLTQIAAPTAQAVTAEARVYYR